LCDNILKLDVSPSNNLTAFAVTGSITESALLTVPFMAEKIKEVLGDTLFCAAVKNIPQTSI